MRVRLKAILPHLPVVNSAKIVAAVRAELNAVGREVKSEFVQTTAGWRTDVHFSVEVGLGTVTVSTDNAIYGYVNNGTKPHLITPRRGKVLRFSGGSGTLYRPRVAHPGTKPKRHSQRIAARWKGKLQGRLQAAISSAAG